MIRLACTACKTVLDVDDAFAGGVCRCSSCGAIQTVPKPDTAPTDAQAPVTGKTLYRKKGQAVVGSGLDELAQVVASSGVHSTRLRRAVASAHAAEPSIASRFKFSSPRRYLWLLLASIAVGMLLGVLYFSLRTPASTPPSPGNPAAPASAAPAAATFASIDLSNAPTVVFLIDRGSSSSEVLSPVKQVVLRTLGQLGKDRQFAIHFWDNGTPTASFPSRGLAYCVPETLSAARSAIDDISGFGQSDLLPRLADVLASRPAAVVIVTAKGFDLDESWSERVEAALAALPDAPKPVIHTLSIGTVGPSAGLKRLSSRSGGTYLELPPAAVYELAGK